jgi:excisionase family DNA binding protein
MQQRINTNQAAKMLGISRQSVLNMIKRGEIPAIFLAGRWRIPREFVERLAREGQAPRARRKHEHG